MTPGVLNLLILSGAIGAYFGVEVGATLEPWRSDHRRKSAADVLSLGPHFRGVLCSAKSMLKIKRRKHEIKMEIIDYSHKGVC